MISWRCSPGVNTKIVIEKVSQKPIKWKEKKKFWKAKKVNPEIGVTFFIVFEVIIFPS